MKAKFLTITILSFMLIWTVNCFAQMPGNKFVAANQAGWPTGLVLENVVSCTGLAGNILSDDPERKVSVYLTPDYYLNTERNYPVIYILGGHSAEHDFWFGGCDPNFKLNETLDLLINKKEIQPMIVVSPNNCNKYSGSWFTNSDLSGNWESFNASELVNYIDKNYRTLSQPESRGIAGCSMGGYGAVTLAMKYPEVFGSVYSINADMLDFTDKIINDPATKSDFINAAQLKDFMFSANPEYLYVFSAAIAFAPNSNSVGFGELPFNQKGDLREDVWQKWLKHDPASMVPEYKENLQKLKAITLEFGEKKTPLKNGNISFSKILFENGIEHSVNSYSGEQDISVNNRMGTHILPFFSQKLEAITTGATDLHSFDFMFYPNPANKSVTIQTYGNQKYSVELLDIAGKKVYQAFVDKNLHQIDISNFSKGTYVVRLKSDRMVTTKKITKL